MRTCYGAGDECRCTLCWRRGGRMRGPASRGCAAAGCAAAAPPAAALATLVRVYDDAAASHPPLPSPPPARLLQDWWCSARPWHSRCCRAPPRLSWRWRLPSDRPSASPLHVHTRLKPRPSLRTQSPALNPSPNRLCSPPASSAELFTVAPCPLRGAYPSPPPGLCTAIKCPGRPV